MSRSHVATALVSLAAGLTASAVLRRLAGRRRPVAAAVRSERTAVRTEGTAVRIEHAAVPAPPVPVRQGVVLPFVRRAEAVPTPAAEATPARCGDNGGRTKAGAPCAARAAGGGRCHHHRVAA